MNIILHGNPDEWNGYRINQDFRTGIRLAQAMEDEDLLNEERWEIALLLMFQDPDGNIRDHPDVQEFFQLLTWFLGGWNHDNSPKEKKRQKLMDYDVDQWRIYADFMRFYGIDLSTADMHYWTFQGLLWSLPSDQSAFMQVIQIRTRKPRKGATKAELDEIAKAREIYGLKQPEEEKSYTREEKDKIDAFDELRRKNK